MADIGLRITEASALRPTDSRADLGKGACYDDVGVEVAMA
jgi:Flp pilus assembly protein TadD